MTRLAFILLSFLLASIVTHADAVDPLAVDSGKSRLVFKADRDMVGGTIKLFLPNGQLIAIQRIRKRKVVIDFSQASFGAYRVVVASGNKSQVLYYMKK